MNPTTPPTPPDRTRDAIYKHMTNSEQRLNKGINKSNKYHYWSESSRPLGPVQRLLNNLVDPALRHWFFCWLQISEEAATNIHVFLKILLPGAYTRLSYVEEHETLLHRTNMNNSNGTWSPLIQRARNTRVAVTWHRILARDNAVINEKLGSHVTRSWVSKALYATLRYPRCRIRSFECQGVKKKMAVFRATVVKWNRHGGIFLQVLFYSQYINKVIHQ